MIHVDADRSVTKQKRNYKNRWRASAILNQTGGRVLHEHAVQVTGTVGVNRQSGQFGFKSHH